MSILQVQTFLKNNHHDILDYYIENKYIKYIKIISRSTGFIFFLNVYNYNIKFEENIDMNKYNFYFIEKTYNIDDFIFQLYQDFTNLFPEIYSKYLFVYGCYLYFDSENVYQIKNLSNSSDLTVFLYYDIEWLYENNYTIAHEVEKLYHNIEHKLNKKYELLNENFLMNTSIHSTFISFKNRITKYRNDYYHIIKLYLKMCLYETKFTQLIDEIEKKKISENSINEALDHSRKKKLYLEKLNQLQILYLKIYDKISFYHFIYWKYQLKFLLYISNSIVQCSSIKNINLEMLDLLNVSNQNFNENI
jgi:hypothetical protein